MLSTFNLHLIELCGICDDHNVLLVVCKGALLDFAEYANIPPRVTQLTLPYLRNHVPKEALVYPLVNAQVILFAILALLFFLFTE